MALKGLTAQDRADWEKQFAAQLEGKTPEQIDRAYIHYKFDGKYKNDENFGNLSSMSAADKEKYWNDSFESRKATPLEVQKPDLSLDTDALRFQRPTAAFEYTPNEEEQQKFRQHSEAYNKALNAFTDRYTNYPAHSRNAVKDIKELANQVSPYYQKYQGTEYLPFNDEDWAHIAAEYNARKLTDGDDGEGALEWLQETIQDECSNNQSQFEKIWNGFRGMGADALAANVAFFIGIPKGIYDYASGNHKDIEGVGKFTNFLDAVLDNNISRWADNVVRYGSLFKATQETAKETGISEIPVIQTYGQEHMEDGMLELMFNRNVPGTLLNQYGYTLASIGEGYALSKMSNWAFKGIKGATLARNMEKTGQTAMQVRNSLTKIQKGENLVNTFLIPGIVGTGEGLMEGLQTKDDFLENGRQQIADMQSQYVDQRFQQLVAEKYQSMYEEAIKPKTFQTTSGEFGTAINVSGGGMTPEQAKEYVLNQLYKEAWDEYDDKYQASVDRLEADAAVAGRTNFLINAGINGLINQTLQASLFNTSIASQIRSSKLGKIFDFGPTTRVNSQGKVSVDFPWYKQAWNYVKEPVGESFEEGAQYLSDKYAQGKAGNDLTNFIRHQYTGEGEVGNMWSNIGAGFAAVGESLTDKDLYLSAWYGLASSAIGGVGAPRRATRANGTRGGLFERGVNGAGERESGWEMAARVMPWRSGVGQAIQTNKAQRKEAEAMAQQLQDWVDDPVNKAKFDGLGGTLSWARDMQESANSNDEFGYRNSALGKRINDAIMLQKLQGTEYYNAIMQQVNEVANLEEGSEVAQQYVERARSSASTGDTFANMSDSEIIEQLKDNANKMLNTINDIQQRGEKLESTLGNLDTDTKEALIYGEMMIDDWNKRGEQLKSELSGIDITNTVNNSSLSDAAKSFISQYGSVEKAISAKEKAVKAVETLSKDVKNLESRKKMDSQQKKTLALKKLKLAQAKASLRTFKALDGIDTQSQVLSESEIMRLDPVTRAEILSPEGRKKYNDEQQAVIDNVISKGTAADPDFMAKIQDAARIEQARDSYVQSYSAVILDPESFNIYKANAKREATKAMFSKRYESLKGIQDYTEFARQMDKLNTDGSPLERQTILAQFTRDEKQARESGESTNFSRYLGQRQQIADIIKHASRNTRISNLNGNDIDMAIHALTYLTERNIDIRDNAAITTALSETDAQGESLFKKYVEEVTKDMSGATRTEFTSSEEALQTLKEIIEAYDTDVKNVEEDFTPIEVSSEPQEVSAPPAMPGIFATAATRIEDTDAEKTAGEGTTTIGTQVNEAGQTVMAQQKSQPSEAGQYVFATQYEVTSSAEVFDAARNMEHLINKSSLSPEDKQTALSMLQGLGSEGYDTAEEFANAFNAEFNKADIANSGLNTNLLRGFTQRIVANAITKRASKQREEELAKRNQGTVLENSPLAQAALGFAPSDARNSNNLVTLNMSELKKSGLSTDPESPKYSPLLKYYETMGVEEYLRTHDLSRDVPVFFMFEPMVAAEQKAVYDKGGYTYSKDNLPVIAVIEDENGPVTIGDKKYQPIGIMPSTGANNQLGSNRLDLVRKALNENAETPYIISDAKGVIETRLSNHIWAQPMQQIPTNISTFEAGLNGETSDSRKLFEDTPVEQRKSSALYQKIKKNFLQRLVVGTSNRGPALYEHIDKLDGHGGSIPVLVLIREVTKTQGIGMTQTIGEMLREGNLSILNSNSRILRWSNALSKFINSTDLSEITVFEDGTVASDSQQELDALSEELDNRLKNFLFPAGYSLKITPVRVDGNIQFTLSMVNDDKAVVLGTFQAGAITDQQKFDILRNMIMDGDNPRVDAGGHEIVKWQVNYRAVNSESNVDRENISHIYDDGIFEVSKKYLDYQVTGVTLEAPYTTEGVRREFVSTTNSDNASTKATSEAEKTVTTPSGKVDGVTGEVLNGENLSIENTEMLEAQKIAETITSAEGMAITGYQSLDELETYKNDSTKTLSEQITNAFMNVFLGRGNSRMKNTTEKSSQNFADQVSAALNKVVASGVTILDKPINATWESGSLTKVSKKVLLGYDTNGQWHVYSPTTRSDTNVEELSMLCRSIEKEFGIKIADYTVFTLKAEEPKGNNIRVEDGQIITNNSHVYSGAHPSLIGVTTIPASEVTSYASAAQRILEMFSDTYGDESTQTTETPSDEPVGIFDDLFGFHIDVNDSEYVPANQTWGVFEGRGLNVAETLKNLESQGITEEKWNKMSEAEREQELGCKGVY